MTVFPNQTELRLRLKAELHATWFRGPVWSACVRRGFFACSWVPLYVDGTSKVVHYTRPAPSSQPADLGARHFCRLIQVVDRTGREGPPGPSTRFPPFARTAPNRNSYGLAKLKPK